MGRNKSGAMALWIPWAFCLLAAALCVSCKTTEAASDAEIGFALRQAGGYALERAFGGIPAKLGSLSCLPPGFAPVAQEEDRIPGLGYLVGKWTARAREGCGREVLFLLDVFKKALDSLEFEDPAMMLLFDSSVSEKLEREKRLEILNLVQQRLEENIDTAFFDAAIAQYNDWLLATGLLGDRVAEPLGLDPVPALAAELVDLVFSELKDAEIKVRTTPELGLDKTYIKVFGLGL